MKYKKWLLLVVLIGIIGCKNNTTNPTEENQTNFRTVDRSFDFNRGATTNVDTVQLTFENSKTEVTLFVNFDLWGILINAYKSTTTKIDTTIIKNGSITVADSHYIKLEWTSINQLNNKGWIIELKNSVGDYKALSMVNGGGTTTDTLTYTYIDHPRKNDTIFYYRLKQISFDESFTYPLEVKVELDANDLIKTTYRVDAENGVFWDKDATVADSGYAHKMFCEMGDVTYFQNAQMNYGKIKLRSFIIKDGTSLRLEESNKKIDYQLSYEMFVQTDGSKNGL